MKNLGYLQYTYLHRKAFSYTLKHKVEEFLTEDEKIEMNQRAKVHDMDKMVLYLVMEKKDAHTFHRAHQPHHVDNDIEKTTLDYIEMIIDWECAASTKPDKPLNAYDTLHKYYSQLVDVIKPLLIKFGMNYSYVYRDNDILEYIDSVGTITKKDIMDEIQTYVL